MGPPKRPEMGFWTHTVCLQVHRHGEDARRIDHKHADVSSGTGMTGAALDWVSLTALILPGMIQARSGHDFRSVTAPTCGKSHGD